VFFLGGIPNPTGGCDGFSTDASNPTKPGGGRTRFFEFKPHQLYQRGGSPFFSCADGYSVGNRKQPYAYFSSYGRDNGYTTMGALFKGTPSDCASLGVSPYIQTVTTDAKGNIIAVSYYNPRTFQILSAGKNQTFGGGGLWTPATAGSIGAAGFDDFSNFYDARLGVAP
jgi:hypothetical protein